MFINSEIIIRLDHCKRVMIIVNLMGKYVLPSICNILFENEIKNIDVTQKKINQTL